MSRRTPWINLVLSLLMAAGLIWLAGCGSDNSTDPVIDEISVSLNPDQVTVRAQHTFQFNAVVSHAANPEVTWSIDEGENWGTIDAAGIYTAPDTVPDPAIATVRAVSVEDTTKQATARVDIDRLIVVEISVPQATVQLGATYQFEAEVLTEKLDGDVVWSLDEGGEWGSIDADGLYTAPAAMPASYSVTVRATSTLDPEAQATARLYLSSVDPATMAPDFLLEDVHPDTPTSGTMVSPRDYLGKVSVWIFIEGRH
jgi:hypothetical protein